MSEENSHSWVRISHGANKYVVDSNYNNTEVLADLAEEQASQTEDEVFCRLMKGKSKTTKREFVDFPSIIPMKQSGLILNQQNLLSLRTRSR